MVKTIVKKYWVYILIAAICVAYYFSLPSKIFIDPYSTILNDKNGNLLSASIASDGQWRFPLSTKVPEKFKQAIVLLEDKRFYSHPGVDLLSMARAVRQNLKAGKIVSGGSTLTMQVVRLSRKNKTRTFFQKIVEVILSTRLELRCSKDEILNLYATHAPFGGNVVGLEAACWRFFGRTPDELSWSEAALLAVLPNNPSLIHLGKNRIKLKVKRDLLLDKMARNGLIDTLSLQLAKAELIPEQPLSLPRMAPHLLTRAIKEGHSQERVLTTIDLKTQLRAIEVIKDHCQRLKANHIYNAAAIIAEVKTGHVLAYVGNTNSGYENNEDVDVVTAPRSTGSILKPILFASMLSEGKMLPNTLWPDVPTFINGYSPKNFSKEYDGAVAASAALIRSLNVPSVYELKEYRYEKLYDKLKDVGITTLNQSADHYGLSLILGGSEGTLWDITSIYASMARTLNNFFERPGNLRYDKRDFHSLSYLEKKDNDEKIWEQSSYLTAASIYSTFDVLQEVYRPGENSGWKNFSSSKRIAWKTGTSFGFRDGWAIGVNPDYVVGVWVGNADGEGRPGLTGTESAAPILFDLFSMLPSNSWFQKPIAEMSEVVICKKSGHRITSLCEEKDTIWIDKAGLQTKPCPYHQKIFLTKDEKFRVHASCESLAKIKSENWFILPPVQEFYFKSKHISYKPVPRLRSDCENSRTVAAIDLIYPKPNAKIFVPRELDGSLSTTVFEAAHRNSSATIFWHIDNQFITATRKNHKLELSPSKGNHTLTLVDDSGESISANFTIQ